MSQEDLYEQLECNPLDKKIFDINQSKEEEESSINIDVEEDSPFNDLQLILGQDDNRKSRQEQNSAVKSNEIQEECNLLSRQNMYLTIRIQQLEADLQNNLKCEINEESVDQFLECMSQQIASYKEQFEQVKQKHILNSKIKDQYIQQLRESLEQYQQYKIDMDQERIALINNNQEIIKTNESLTHQIGYLQSMLADYQNKIQQHSIQRYPNSKGLQTELQTELEILIQKLVAELQIQRAQKKKLSEEIKRMQQNLMDLQRQKVVKNNRIYALEMNFLKTSRNSPKKVNIQNQKLQPSLRLNKSNSQLNGNRNGKSDRPNITFKMFSISQLLNETYDVNERQKLIICSKIIDFYLKRLNSKDYTTYTLEQLLICNYSKINPNLVLIKKDPTIVSSNGNLLTPEKLIQNLMGFLQVIINQAFSFKKQRSQIQEQLMDLIKIILEGNTLNLQDVYEMKQIIDDMAKSKG